MEDFDDEEACRHLPRAKKEKLEIFTTGLVQELQRAVMRGDAGYKHQPGDLRQNVVWIGGRGDIAYSTYNPAPPPEIAPCLEDTMKYMRCEGMQAMYQTGDRATGRE